ncbi:hypothetical protein [Dapis sp. BLCC M229]|uniref:hypothetical protein n=1 Tax=Dapis sp. BLCC M229 TaxID=3400188 RepID=UPI003CF17DA3
MQNLRISNHKLPYKLLGLWGIGEERIGNKNLIMPKTLKRSRNRMGFYPSNNFSIFGYRRHETLHDFALRSIPKQRKGKNGALPQQFYRLVCAIL